MIFKRKGKILLGVFLAMSLLVFGASCSDKEDDEPSISIAGETTVAAGSEITLTATKNNFSSTISWTVATGSDYAEIKESSDTSCVVKGIKAGTATIRASAAGATRDYAVTVTGEASGGTGVYADFANYPNGKKDPNGTLKLKNLVAQEVLVFTDKVSAETYIGTIPALENITVKLTGGKFYNIVSVIKSVYEENPLEATPTSTLSYYSDTQGYTVSVSPSDLTGSGTWIFNNNTNYWVKIQSVDDTETYAVIAPGAARVKIPASTSKNYDYKIIYMKELKYNSKTLAISEVSRKEQNDTAAFRASNNYQFTTDLTLNLDSEYDALAPSVQLINNSGKSVRVFKGNLQVTSFGELDSDDYVALDGETAFFTGFTANSSSTTVGVRSTAWVSDGPITCTEDVTFKKGKVYVITLGKNTAEGATSPVTWTVVEKSASEIYDAE